MRKSVFRKVFKLFLNTNNLLQFISVLRICSNYIVVIKPELFKVGPKNRLWSLQRSFQFGAFKAQIEKTINFFLKNVIVSRIFRTYLKISFDSQQIYSNTVYLLRIKTVTVYHILNQKIVLSSTDHCAVIEIKISFSRANHEVVSRGLINLFFKGFFIELNIKLKRRN